MTNNDHTTKRCRTCQVTKSISEFYISSSNQKPMVDCKECHKQRCNTHYTPKTITEAARPHEDVLVQELALRGIFAVGGKASMFRGAKTDLVAWGCIRIEAKLAVWDRICWRVGFTRQQREKANFDFCIVILPRKPQWGYYVLPVDCGIFPAVSEYLFYYPQGHVHIRKTRNGQSNIPRHLMDKYESAWYLIEEKRQSLILQMQQGNPIDYSALQSDEAKSEFRQTSMF